MKKKKKGKPIRLFSKDDFMLLECELRQTRERLLLLALEVKEAIFDAEQYGVEILNESAAVRARVIADEILHEENNQRR